MHSLNCLCWQWLLSVKSIKAQPLWSPYELCVYCSTTILIFWVDLSFKCVFIPDWRIAAWVLCICRTGRWKPVFQLWWRPRIYCPDSRRSYDPSEEVGTQRRCIQSRHRNPAGQETEQELSTEQDVSVKCPCLWVVCGISMKSHYNPISEEEDSPTQSMEDEECSGAGPELGSVTADKHTPMP